MKPVEPASVNVSEHSEAELSNAHQAEEFFIPPEFMPRYDDLITEDDTPVDNLFSEKQMRLLTEPLYASWQPTHPRYGSKFLALANVGLFYADHEPALVPDVMLSLGVEAPKGDLGKKENRSYFIWHFGGKTPEVVIEIVSNLKGGELGDKMEKYASLAHIPYYIVYDPFGQYGEASPLRIFANSGWEYTALDVADVTLLQRLELALTLWEGEYEGVQARWLRWCDASGNLIPTGKERADTAEARAEAAEARAEALAAKLRALGIEP
jgi:Uma2 family endonuclease